MEQAEGVVAERRVRRWRSIAEKGSRQKTDHIVR
jgi:hypothetical protein